VAHRGTDWEAFAWVPGGLLQGGRYPELGCDSVVFMGGWGTDWDRKPDPPWEGSMHWAQPVADAMFDAHTDVVLEVAASVQVGTIGSVRFYLDGRLLGNGGVLEWTDVGSPETESLPALARERFYRIVLAP